MASQEYDLVLDRRDVVKYGATGIAAMIAGCTGGDDSSSDGGSGDGSGGGGSGGDGGSGDGSDDSDMSGDGGSTTGRLNVGLNFPPQNLDPGYAHGPTSQLLVQLLVEPVVYVDPAGKIQAGAATEVPRPTNDGRTYEYTLREGLTFHNGDPVTAEDFKASIEWQENPENVSPLEGRLPFLESVEVAGDRTVRITLEKAFGLFNSWMAVWFRGIVPKGARKSVSEGGGSSGGASTNLSDDMSGVGSGPFEFVEWQSGNHLLLESFDDYHVDDLPNVGEVNFTFVTESSTRLAQLESRSIDMTNTVPSTNAAQMENNPNIDLLEYPGNLWQVVYTNLQPIDGNPMANRNNRRALMFAIDREEIAEEVFRNRAQVKKTMWYKDTQWSSPKVDETDLYQPEQARAELEKAGNPDGYQLKLLTISRDLFSRYATTIQNQLSRVGIEAELIPQEESAHFSRVYTANDWHAAATYGGVNIPNPMSLMQVIYGNNKRNHHQWHHAADDLPDKWEPSGPPAPDDAQGDYSNGHEWFVNYLEDTLAEPDPERQRQRVYRMQEYLVDNAIGPHVVFRNTLQAKRSYVTGYESGTWRDEYRGISVDK
jgi:ABC-type transport system substrate-binding protein